MSGPAGNYYPKYHTKNPLARLLVDQFLKSFSDLSGSLYVDRALEIGCGEGHLSMMLAQQGKKVCGVDLSEDIIEHARRNAQNAGIPIDFEAADIYALDAKEYAAPLVVCCEVLEHLPDTQAALEQLAKLAQPYLLVSVPREPLWRGLNMARGAYLKDFGNTPGHIQHWSKTQFLTTLERHFNILEVRTPIPWTMALLTSIVND